MWRILFFACLFVIMPESPACEEVHREGERSRVKDILDNTHGYVSSTINDIARDIDTFFVDERVDEELKTSRLRVRLGGKLVKGGESDLWQRVRLNIRLPRTERRLQLVVDGFSDDEPIEEIQEPSNKDDTVDTALRYIIRETRADRLQFSTGLSFGPETNVYVRIRWRGVFSLKDSWIICPTQFLFWRTDDGAGQRTRLDIERKIFKDKNDLFRIRGDVTWSEIVSGLEFGASISYSPTISELCGYSFSFRADGNIDASRKKIPSASRPDAPDRAGPESAPMLR